MESIIWVSVKTSRFLLGTGVSKGRNAPGGFFPTHSGLFPQVRRICYLVALLRGEVLVLVGDPTVKPDKQDKLRRDVVRLSILMEY